MGGGRVDQHAGGGVWTKSTEVLCQVAGNGAAPSWTRLDEPGLPARGICAVDRGLDFRIDRCVAGWARLWPKDVVYGRRMRRWPQMQLQTTRPGCDFEFKPEDVTILPMRTALFVGHCLRCWKGISRLKLDQQLDLEPSVGSNPLA